MKFNKVFEEAQFASKDMKKSAYDYKKSIYEIKPRILKNGLNDFDADGVLRKKKKSVE